MAKVRLIMDAACLGFVSRVGCIVRDWEGPLLPAGTKIFLLEGKLPPGLKGISVVTPSDPQNLSICYVHLGTVADADVTFIDVEADLDFDLIDEGGEASKKISAYLRAHGWREEE